MTIEILTAQQVADILQLNIQTVWRYIRKGELKSIKINNTHRIDKKDLELFIQKRKQGGEAGDV